MVDEFFFGEFKAFPRLASARLVSAGFWSPRDTGIPINQQRFWGLSACFTGLERKAWKGKWWIYDSIILKVILKGLKGTWWAIYIHIYIHIHILLNKQKRNKMIVGFVTVCPRNQYTPKLQLSWGFLDDQQLDLGVQNNSDKASNPDYCGSHSNYVYSHSPFTNVS
jgi:hypothetical protein